MKRKSAEKRFAPKVRFRIFDKAAPLGALFNSTHIEIIGTEEVLIEGCRGILEYDAESIRLSGGGCTVVIRGDGLELRSLGDARASVRGRVSAVELI